MGNLGLHLLARRRFSSESSATNSFKSRISWQAFNLARGRLAPGVAGEPLLARFQKTLSTSCNTDPRRCPRGGTRRRCSPRRAGPTPRSGSSPQPYTACVSCGEYPEPFSPPGRSCSLISVSSSFPSVTTMKPEILRYAITSICPKGADVRRINRTYRVLPTIIRGAFDSEGGEALTYLLHTKGRHS